MAIQEGVIFMKFHPTKALLDLKAWLNF